VPQICFGILRDHIFSLNSAVSEIMRQSGHGPSFSRRVRGGSELSSVPIIMPTKLSMHLQISLFV
jgi:hypothetical protein